MALHWFPFFPGDFISGSIRFSFHERGTYALMIVAYYANAGPFPLDITETYRMAGCESDQDRRAVDRVLQRKFVKTDSGWIHERCERVIAEQQAGRNRRIEAANKRWSKAYAMHEQSICLQNQNQNQNQKLPAPKERDIVSGLPKKPANSDASARVLEFLNQTAGKRFRPKPINLNFIDARLVDGITETELRQIVVRKCREWLPDEKMRAYLTPKTLFCRTNCEQYIGNLIPPSQEKTEL